MLETASGESAAYDQVIRKTIDYRVAIGGHGVHAGFPDCWLAVVQLWQVIANIAGDLGDILFGRSQKCLSVVH